MIGSRPPVPLQTPPPRPTKDLSPGEAPKYVVKIVTLSLRAVMNARLCCPLRIFSQLTQS